MKNLIPLSFLLSLVSCIDSLPTRSTIPRGISDKSTLQVASSLKQGQIIRTHKTGETMNPVVLNEDDSLKRHEVNSEILAVVLKVDAGKYYEYQEIHDYVAGKVKKQVQLKHIQSMQLYKNQAVLSDKTIRLSGSSKNTLEPALNVKVKFRQDLSSILNSENLNCDRINETEESVVVLKSAKQVHTDYAMITEKITCDGILNSTEFANLDLSSIEFCDMTSEEAECGLYNLNSLKKLK